MHNSNYQFTCTVLNLCIKRLAGAKTEIISHFFIPLKQDIILGTNITHF